MAMFTIDPTDPSMVLDSAGRAVPASLVDPADIAPASGLGVTSVGSVGQSPAQLVETPAASPRAQSVLAKLNDPAIAAVRGPGLQLAQQSTTTVTGRNAGNVQKQIDDEATAGAALDTQLQQSGTAADERVNESYERRMYGVQGAQGRAEEQRFQSQERQKEIAGQRQKLEAELKANDQSFDADRLIRNMSTGAKLGTVILGMLQGAFDNVNDRKGPNRVLEVIDARIKEDIQAQKDQIASGRVRIGNHIAELMRKGFDAETAERLAEDRLNAAADQLIQLDAERLGLQGQQRQNADMVVAQRLEQRAARQGELRAQTESRSQTTATYARPAAPSYADAVESIKAQRDLESLQRSGLTQPEYDKQAEKYAGDARVLNQSIAAATRVAKALGGDVETIRDESGNVTGYRVVGDLDAPHIGDRATQYEQAQTMLRRADTMAMSREPSARLQDAFAAISEMPFRDSQKKVALQGFLDSLANEQSTVRGGFNPNVVRDVEGRVNPVQVPTPTLRNR
jgi:hypothetical protein